MMEQRVSHISLHCFLSELSVNTDPPVTGRTILFHINTDTTLINQSINQSLRVALSGVSILRNARNVKNVRDAMQ